MRILLHDRSGHAFPVQLSRELARRGHQVLHSYGAFFQAPKGDLIKHTSDPEGFSVEGLHLAQPFQKYSFVKRWFQEREYARRLVVQIHDYDPDVLVLAQLMPDAQAYVYRHLRERQRKIVFWVQDLYGIAIKKILRNSFSVIGDLIGQYYIRTEQALLKESDAVVLITEDFRPILSQWGVPLDTVSVIPNWGPLEQLPVRLKANPWAKAHKLDDKVCFLYAGTMGMKHNPGLLLDLALHFRIVTMFVSWLYLRDWARSGCSSRKTRSILITLSFWNFSHLSRCPMSSVLPTFWWRCWSEMQVFFPFPRRCLPIFVLVGHCCWLFLWKTRRPRLCYKTMLVLLFRRKIRSILSKLVKNYY